MLLWVVNGANVAHDQPENVKSLKNAILAKISTSLLHHLSTESKLENKIDFTYKLNKKTRPFHDDYTKMNKGYEKEK